jgi:2-oxoisovalerate dehydrogenase E1 component beta subunit
MSGNTTFTEADRTDGVEPDMVTASNAPASTAPDTGVQPPVLAMNMIQALNSALDVKMAEDRDVLSFGEDAGYFGGVFRVTDHLQKKHGLTRSFDAPISECGIVAAAIGMGAYGLRPVVEIQFADYIYPAYDQIVSDGTRTRSRPGRLRSWPRSRPANTSSRSARRAS